jgi:hypothetical protein
MHVDGPLLNRVFSTIIFYVGWILCLQEASKGHSYYGLILVSAFILYFLYHSSCRKADFLLLSFVLLIGPLSDILYVQLGLLEYHVMPLISSWMPPLWVFVLWGLFGANIQLFSWLNRHWWLAILLGALGGPISYLSVVRLGGASLLMPLPLVMIVIGGIWAIFFPAFIWLNDYLKKRFGAYSTSSGVS